MFCVITCMENLSTSPFQEAPGFITPPGVATKYPQQWRRNLLPSVVPACNFNTLCSAKIIHISFWSDCFLHPFKTAHMLHYTPTHGSVFNVLTHPRYHLFFLLPSGKRFKSSPKPTIKKLLFPASPVKSLTPPPLPKSRAGSWILNMLLSSIVLHSYLVLIFSSVYLYFNLLVFSFITCLTVSMVFHFFLTTDNKYLYVFLSL